MIALLLLVAAAGPGLPPPSVGLAVPEPMVFVGTSAPVILHFAPAVDPAAPVVVTIVDGEQRREGRLVTDDVEPRATAQGRLLTLEGLGPLAGAVAVDVTARPRVADETTLRMTWPRGVGREPVAVAVFDWRGRVDGVLFVLGEDGVRATGDAPVPDVAFVPMRTTAECGGTVTFWMARHAPVRARAADALLCLDEDRYVARVVIEETTARGVVTRFGVATGTTGTDVISLTASPH